MGNNKKYIPWIILVIILAIISICIIWYFRKPPKLDIIEDSFSVESSLMLEEVICKI